MRFNIRIDPIWRGRLILGGATSQNSYVILGDDGMHFRLGLLFNRTIPYDQVAAVFPRSWPFLYGIGWSSNLRGVIGLTGSYHDVVEVRMKQRIGNWAAIFPCDRIAVSLEEPELFIEELSRRTGLAEPPDINALSKPKRQPTKPAKRATNVGKRPSAARTGKLPKPVAAAVVTATEVTTAMVAAAEEALSRATAPAEPAASNGAAAVAPRRAGVRPAPTPKATPKPKPKAAKTAAPKATAAKPASTSAKANGSKAATAPKPSAAKRAPAVANGQTKPQASAPAKAPAKKPAAPKQAVRKAARSRTAVRARRSRTS